MSYSRVGAHAQNGVVERGIQDIATSARTMMLHQALMWPAHFDMRLWTFALEHAAYIWNLLLDARFHVDRGISLIEIYTSSKLDTIHLWNENTWGCPAYVLEPRVQDGEKIPK